MPPQSHISAHSPVHHLSLIPDWSLCPLDNSVDDPHNLHWEGSCWSYPQDHFLPIFIIQLTIHIIYTCGGAILILTSSLCPHLYSSVDDPNDLQCLTEDNLDVLCWEQSQSWLVALKSNLDWSHLLIYQIRFVEDTLHLVLDLYSFYQLIWWSTRFALLSTICCFCPRNLKVNPFISSHDDLPDLLCWGQSWSCPSGPPSQSYDQLTWWSTRSALLRTILILSSCPLSPSMQLLNSSLDKEYSLLCECTE
jgi:hypothetical protein